MLSNGFTNVVEAAAAHITYGLISYIIKLYFLFILTTKEEEKMQEKMKKEIISNKMLRIIVSFVINWNKFVVVVFIFDDILSDKTSNLVIDAITINFKFSIVNREGRSVSSLHFSSGAKRNYLRQSVN